MTTEGRRLAETGIAQAKQAYERWAEAGEIALNAFEASTGRAVAGLRGPSEGGQARAAGTVAVAARGWAGLREIAQQMLIASDTNMRAGFDLAERLVRVTDLAEAAELQRRFLREQAERLATQITDLQQTTLRVAREVVQPESTP